MAKKSERAKKFLFSIADVIGSLWEISVKKTCEISKLVTFDYLENGDKCKPRQQCNM